MAQKISPAPAMPGMADPFNEKTNWLVQTHVFDSISNRVVKLYEPSARCMMSVDAFKTLYMPWWQMVPRGNRSVMQYATDIWMRHPTRAEIGGVRMRPDRNFPSYLDDDGQHYKNTYRKPVHKEDVDGDIEPFLRFLARFLPGEEDREYLLNWMAHKWLYPEIPGASVWFVADSDDGPLEGKYGTGRGFMARIAHKLYGEAYCKAEDFDILIGTSAQAVYTDWQSNCVLITVDEAQTSPTGHRQGERRSVYTALKNCLDPAPKRRTFKAKGLPAYDGISYCSIWVATNHANAAAIPKNDRRVTVLRNGSEMTKPEREEIAAWIDAPGSIAALAYYLESSEEHLKDFDMYTPMRTEAKDEMADLALNDVELMLEDFASDDDRGLVFPKMFLEQAVIEALSGGSERGSNVNVWRGQFAGAVAAYCRSVRTANGDKARIWVNKHRYILFAFRSRLRQAEALTETERREHAARWGHLDPIQTVLKEVPKDRK